MTTTAEPVEIEDPLIHLCKVCQGEIHVQCFKGTGACSGNHHKVLAGEWTPEKLAAVEQGLLREDGIK